MARPTLNPDEPSVRIVVTIPTSHADALKTYAASKGRTVSSQVRLLIERAGLIGAPTASAPFETAGQAAARREALRPDYRKGLQVAPPPKKAP